MNKDMFNSIWNAVEEDPGTAENMKMRSRLMMAPKAHMSSAGWSQAQAAKLLGVTQPRVSDLMRGKINLFALDAMVNMAVAAGLQVELQIRSAASVSA